MCVSMSKRAEDEAVVEGVQPNKRMLYIGADFYTHECEYPKFRGQDKSLARFEEVMKEWSAHSPGQLMPRCCSYSGLLACASFTDGFSGECGAISTAAYGASENGVVTTA